MEDRGKITLIAAVCVLVIILYGHYRCGHAGYADPLTKAWASPPWDRYLDGWGISHFAFFFGLAYMYPREIPYIWSLGVVWELAEFLSEDHPFYLSDCQLTTDAGQGWWYGRWEDIVMNTLGVAAAGLFTSSRLGTAPP